MEARFHALVERLSAPADLVRLFAECIQEVIRGAQDQSARIRSQIESRIHTLAEQRLRTVEAIVAGKIPETDGDSLLARYDEQLADLELELDDARRDLPEADDLLGAAERLLRDPAEAWRKASARGRLALQAFLFPEGVRFDGWGFETPVTSPLFSQFRAWERGSGDPVGI